MLHTQPGVAEQFIKDVREEVAIIMKNPKEKTTGMVSVNITGLLLIVDATKCIDSGRMQSLTGSKIKCLK